MLINIDISLWMKDYVGVPGDTPYTDHRVLAGTWYLGIHGPD